ncbi:MAG: hypothetical protein ACLUD2_18165 [Clostridium sp.]
MALVSAFLPYGAIGCLLGAVMLAHIYAVSMETALITAVILIIPDPAVLRVPARGQLLAGADAHGISAEDPIRGCHFWQDLAGSLLTVIPVGSGVVIALHHFLCQSRMPGCTDQMTRR